MQRYLPWLFLATSTLLFGDGGAVILHQRSSVFVITVFASPAPPRAGIIDVSVLLQQSDTLEPVLDADVQLAFSKNGSPLQVQATHGQTQNKLLYAASVRLDAPGDWHYTVTVRTTHDSSIPVGVSGIIALAAQEPKLTAYGSYLALPFVCLGIFALHQRLRWNNCPQVKVRNIR